MIAIANKATLTSTRMIAVALPSAVSARSSPTRRAISAEDQLARPDRALEREGDDEDDVDQMLRARRGGSA